MIRGFEWGFWALAVVWCVLAIWPASYWMDAGKVRIDDIQHGERLQLFATGGAKRSFTGSYSVIIRRVSDLSVVSDDHSGKFGYRANSERPDPIFIDWWSPGDERAHNLKPGTYIMETCWTIYNAFYGLVPTKTTCTTSNVFRVLPKG